jgi:hypothetical protein
LTTANDLAIRHAGVQFIDEVDGATMTMNTSSGWKRNKRLPPGSKWHQYWCGIFAGKRCDCDDGYRPPKPRRRPLLGGGAVKQKERELEDAS